MSEEKGKGCSKRRFSSEEVCRKKIPKISNSELQDSDPSFIKLNDSSAGVDWMGLPEEIWSSIFSWIPTKDKVSSRLVSKKWKDNVDLLSSFKVRLDGRMSPRKLDQIREKRIQSIELLSLQPDFIPEFKYPNYVKELIVTTLVSPRNFVKLCEEFPDVQSLRFFSTLRSDITFDPLNKELSRKALGSLKKLREIDIAIHSFAPRAVWSSETFNIIFNEPLLAFPYLSTISINMILHHEEIRVFFKFLLGRKSIKNITGRISCAALSRSAFNEDVRFSKEQWFGELKDLEFESLQIYHSQTCGVCDLDDVWTEILQNQRSLVRLTADYTDVTVSDVLEILRGNKHLRVCKLYRVICHLFDSDGVPKLSQCSESLEELSLDFVNSAVISCNPFNAHQLEMRFFDFSHLPKSLRKLAIRGHNLSGEQFLTTLAGLEHVEELNVGNCVFRDSSSRIPLFKEILGILGSERCGVRRFLFDTFEIPELSEERKRWRILEDAARAFGILQEPEQNCVELMECERPFYDFRFTKLEMKEFATMIQGLSIEREAQ